MFTQSAEAQEFTASFEKMFNEEAERIGKKTGFIQRQRKLTAKAFALGLLFAWMQNPESSVEELTNAVVLAGSPMKTSSLEERFTPAAAEFFRCLLQFAVQHKLDSSASRSFGLLSAFSAVYINDCSSVSLPKELSSLWQGCGGTCGENAALKASVRYELLSGRLDGPILSEGREHDTKTSLYREPVKENSLTLNDLGFFHLAHFRELHEQGAFFLSRLKSGTNVMHPDGRLICLEQRLFMETASIVEMPVLLGKKERLPVRLIALRLEPAERNKRLENLKEKARSSHQPTSPTALALVGWTIMVTNAPLEKLAASNVWNVYRVRWQIELLFRLWKKDGKWGESRSQKPWRVLCEVYAKALVGVIKHRSLQACGWLEPEHSLEKASEAVCGFAILFLYGFTANTGVSIAMALEALSLVIRNNCKISSRRKRPSTWQHNTPDPLVVSDVIA